MSEIKTAVIMLRFNILTTDSICSTSPVHTYSCQRTFIRIRLQAGASNGYVYVANVKDAPYHKWLERDKLMAFGEDPAQMIKGIQRNEPSQHSTDLRLLIIKTSYLKY